MICALELQKKTSKAEKIARGYKYQTAAEPSQHLYEYHKDTDLSPMYFLYNTVFKLLIGLNETSCKPCFSIHILH